jgi:predicted anti-sigma-YlaC factor YlaD
MERDYLTCREMVELVTEYLEGAMGPREQAIFQAHLAVCPGCTAYLEQMRATISLVGKLTEEHVSPEAKHGLLEVFRGWKKETGLTGS